MGLEPTIVWVEVRWIYQFFYYKKFAVCVLYGASNGTRTRIVSMANWKTNHCPIPAYMEPATGVEPATYWLQISCAANCATPAEKGKEFGEQFQSHASSMELHNLEYAQRTEVLVRRSWSSECSIGEAGIVFTWLLMLVYELMDRDTGFEPAPSAWKAEMLAADTNPGFEDFSLNLCINIISRFSRKIKFLLPNFVISK